MNLLFVAHGSRLPAYQEDAQAFLEAWKNKFPSHQARLCYLELVEPSFEYALEEAVNDTYIMPLFLHEGWHFKHDITELLTHTEKQVTMLQPLTFDRLLITALHDRFLELPEQNDGALVIYSHGSSVSETRIHLVKLGAELQGKVNLKCVVAVAKGEPSLMEVCQHFVAAGEKKITILPHFLFSGLWQKKLDDSVKILQEAMQLDVRIAEPLGHHPALFEMIEMEMNALK